MSKGRWPPQSVGTRLLHATSTVSPFYAPGAHCLYHRDAVTELSESYHSSYVMDVYLIVPLFRFGHPTSREGRWIREDFLCCAERNRATNLVLFSEISTLTFFPRLIFNILAKIFPRTQDLKVNLRILVRLIRNLRLLLRKRARIPAYPRMPAGDVTRHFRGKSTPGSSFVTNLAGWSTLSYSRAEAIHTYGRSGHVIRGFEPSEPR